MQITRLYDEVAIMRGLKTSTFALIRYTDEIKPIKKLIEVHDIIDLNLVVQQQFQDYKDAPIWDIPALKDLNRLRCELMVYHHSEFHPFSMLDRYNSDLIRLFNIMALRTQKQIN